jgi:REP element-mobilizing transposase RayT
MASPDALGYDSIYHIYNRGVNRQDIFFEPINYAHFLHLHTRFLFNYVDTYAYCLLKNHFHLLIRVKEEEEIMKLNQSTTTWQTDRKLPTPSKRISDFFNAYAKGINARYGSTGSLFQHPFGRKIISSDTRLWTVITYIHQNPQRHRFVNDFRNWPYSSYQELINNGPGLLDKEVVLDLFGGMESYLHLSNEWVSDAKEKWCLDDSD